MSQIKIALKIFVKYFEEILCSIIFSSLIFTVALQIICRYLLNRPLSWPEELAGYLVVWFGLLGAVVAMKHKAHTMVQFLLSRVTTKINQILFGLSYVLISSVLWIMIIVGCIVAIKTNFPTVTLPFGWTEVYAVLPVSALLMFIRLTQTVFKTFRSSHRPPAKPEA